MYARVVTFTGVNDIDGAIRTVRQEVLPLLAGQSGYRGLSVSAERAGGVLGALSLWESEAARDASESALAKTREQTAGQFGTAPPVVETFEERVVEMARPPAVGSPLMVTRISMDPAAIDDNLGFFTSQVLPQIKAAPGFRALRNMIDPRTGRGLVGTVWDSPEAMRAAADAAMARRPEAVARGVSFGETSYREIVLIEMP